MLYKNFQTKYVHSGFWNHISALHVPDQGPLPAWAKPGACVACRILSDQNSNWG